VEGFIGMRAPTSARAPGRSEWPRSAAPSTVAFDAPSRYAGTVSESIRRPSPRAIIGELLGFDPFRATLQPEASGVDVQRVESGYRLEIPVAGFGPEDVEITIEERQLAIAGRTARRRFTRSIFLPEEIDAERVDAHVEHGLLTLVLPLVAKMQPRRIPVRSSRASDEGPTVETVSGEVTEGSTSTTAP
jgi:HSP20 family protein